MGGNIVLKEFIGYVCLLSKSVSYTRKTTSHILELRLPVVNHITKAWRSRRPDRDPLNVSRPKLTINNNSITVDLFRFHADCLWTSVGELSPVSPQCEAACCPEWGLSLALPLSICLRAMWGSPAQHPLAGHCSAAHPLRLLIFLVRSDK